MHGRSHTYSHNHFLYVSCIANELQTIIVRFCIQPPLMFCHCIFTCPFYLLIHYFYSFGARSLLCRFFSPFLFFSVFPLLRIRILLPLLFHRFTVNAIANAVFASLRVCVCVFVWMWLLCFDFGCFYFSFIVLAVQVKCIANGLLFKIPFDNSLKWLQTQLRHGFLFKQGDFVSLLSPLPAPQFFFGWA